jgi:hypothetical protein
LERGEGALPFLFVQVLAEGLGQDTCDIFEAFDNFRKFATQIHRRSVPENLEGFLNFLNFLLHRSTVAPCQKTWTDFEHLKNIAVNRYRIGYAGPLKIWKDGFWAF